MKQILIADNFKKMYGGKWTKISTFSSYDVDTLKLRIEERYKVKLVKHEQDDFPYFVEGGFKYQCKTKNFEFMTTARIYYV